MSQPRVNNVVLVAGMAVIIPLLILFAVSFGNDPHAVPSVLGGQPAPAFTLTTLDGDQVDFKTLAGTPVVLNFWSTWCGPCKAEHSILQEGQRRHPEVTFLGVIYNDEAAACKRYLDRVGTTYQHLDDPNGRVAIDYGVAGVPETFFIDPGGTIVHKQAGPVSWPVLQNLIARITEGA